MIMSSTQYDEPDSCFYKPLDKATRSIRLLSFAESPPNSPHNLHFTLTVHKLPTDDEPTRTNDQRVNFIALSYVWGNPEPDFSIFVDGKRLKVRANLYALLRVLHSKAQTANSPFLVECPYLWADAICIDQNSREEKNHQVNMMGDIYLQAEYVIAWLGPSADESRVAMRCLKEAGCLSMWEFRLEPQELDALVAFFNRPYWQRLWIVQEFILPKKILLLCGHSLITLCGKKGLERIEAIRRAIRLRFAEPPVADDLLKARQGWELNQEAADIHRLVSQFKNHGCEKREDRIFALLALFRLGTLNWKFDYPRMTADYGIPPERLFYRVLTQCRCISEYAERDLQEALSLPYCKVETFEEAKEVVGAVSGFQDLWRLGEDEQLLLENLTFFQLVRRGIISERIQEEVMGHLKKLTNLTTEEMYQDPEGTCKSSDVCEASRGLWCNNILITRHGQPLTLS